jgi:hypothetical protein
MYFIKTVILKKLVMEDFVLVEIISAFKKEKGLAKGKKVYLIYDKNK